MKKTLIKEVRITMVMDVVMDAIVDVAKAIKKKVVSIHRTMKE